MRASIDQLTEKLLRQVKDYRGRRSRRSARANGGVEVGTTLDESPPIVKTKQFAVTPMSPEEAVLQLELVGHDFFVFKDVESSAINVVYRRRTGGYGLIEPQG